MTFIRVLLIIMIIIIIIQLYFRPQTIDKNIQIQHGKIIICTIVSQRFSLRSRVKYTQLYNQKITNIIVKNCSVVTSFNGCWGARIGALAAKIIMLRFFILEWTTSLDSSSGSLICDSLTHSVHVTSDVITYHCSA